MRYEFSNCSVEVDDDAERVTTTFANGTTLVAAPNDDEQSINRARALGYEGSDREVLWEMTRWHDVLHSLAAEAMGYPWSEVLWHVAHGLAVPSSDRASREERLVLFLQRLAASGLDAVLAQYVR